MNRLVSALYVLALAGAPAQGQGPCPETVVETPRQVIRVPQTRVRVPGPVVEIPPPVLEMEPAVIQPGAGCGCVPNTAPAQAAVRPPVKPLHYSEHRKSVQWLCLPPLSTVNRKWWTDGFSREERTGILGFTWGSTRFEQ